MSSVVSAVFAATKRTFRRDLKIYIFISFSFIFIFSFLPFQSRLNLLFLLFLQKNKNNKQKEFLSLFLKSKNKEAKWLYSLVSCSFRFRKSNFYSFKMEITKIHTEIDGIIEARPIKHLENFFIFSLKNRDLFEVKRKERKLETEIENGLCHHFLKLLFIPLSQIYINRNFFLSFSSHFFYH
jgi:hypothetical protein